MSRFSKYFIQNILCLDDGLCRYYVQDRLWCHNEILDVPVVVYDRERDAERMLLACMAHNAFFVVDQLRGFLTEACSGYHFVYKMADHEVVRAVAGELVSRTCQVVIEPGHGWAVQIDESTDQAAVPVSVSPEAELSHIFEELKAQLDAMVAEQQKKYDRYEAELAEMSDAEQAVLYSKKAGTGVFGFVGDIVDMVKAFPGFYVGYLKTLGKIAIYPSQLSAIMVESVATGSLGLLQAEIHKFVKPIAQTNEEVKRYTSMLQVLITDKETLEILYDFGQRYYDATHPLELTEIGASAASDIVVTVLLAIFTAGVGAAANVAAKSTKLAKVAKLLQKLAKMLKRVGHRQKLPKKKVSGAGFAKAIKKRTGKVKKGSVLEPDRSEPKSIKNVQKISNKAGAIKVIKGNLVWKNFNSPGDAYKYVNNIKDDSSKISSRQIRGISKKDAIRLKKEIREFTMDDEYPGISHTKIDEAIDKYVDKELSERDIRDIKEYVFKDELLSPKNDSPIEIQASYYRQVDQWLKLSEGKSGANEVVFLRHELAEMAIKRSGGLEKFGKSIGRNPNFTHSDAHMAVDEIFDCSNFDDLFMNEYK